MGYVFKRGTERFNPWVASRVWGKQKNVAASDWRGGGIPLGEAEESGSHEPRPAQLQHGKQAATWQPQTAATPTQRGGKAAGWLGGRAVRVGGGVSGRPLGEAVEDEHAAWSKWQSSVGALGVAPLPASPRAQPFCPHTLKQQPQQAQWYRQPDAQPVMGGSGGLSWVEQQSLAWQQGYHGDNVDAPQRQWVPAGVQVRRRSVSLSDYTRETHAGRFEDGAQKSCRSQDNCPY
eukprot:365291-Chlamydomonas_euryale.AAC.19